MTTHLYILTRGASRNLGNEFSPCWGSNQVTVTDGDWYAARSRCLRHAATNGHDKAVILVDTVRLLHRKHWNGLGEQTKLVETGRIDRHNLWVYLDRLLNRFAHVYVPPMRACRTWESVQAHPCTYLNSPVIPLVAGYQVGVANKAKHPYIGWHMVRAGYDSLTVSDYFFKDMEYEPVLDESGTATSWNTAYFRAINAIAA